MTEEPPVPLRDVVARRKSKSFAGWVTVAVAEGDGDSSRNLLCQTSLLRQRDMPGCNPDKAGAHLARSARVSHRRKHGPETKHNDKAIFFICVGTKFTTPGPASTQVLRGQWLAS